MKIIVKNLIKKTFLLLLIILSEVNLSKVDFELKSLKKGKLIPSKEPPHKEKINYDIIFEKDINKNLSRDMRYKSFSDDNNVKALNAEILTSKPPSDESENEQEIYPSTAIASSEHRWGWWFWTIYHYPAVNAISGRNWGHWESARGRQEDFWEAVFDKPRKINIVEINFITLPHHFQVYFKLDDGASDYICISEDYKVGEFIDPNTGRRTNADLISKTYAVVFHKPIFAKRVKIVMKKPFFSNYFAIEKVKFFQKRSYVIVKNEMLDYCQNYCFFVNTNIPRNDIILEAYPCIEILNLSDNRELFVNYNDRSLRLSNNQGKCVGFNGAKDLVLKSCNDYEPSYAVDFKADNTLYFEGYKNECIYIDGTTTYSNNFINQETIINVTSEGDLQTYKKENMKIYGNNFWSSNPGEKKVSLQILFGKFKNENENFDYEMKKVDVIRIDWKNHPKKFKLYTWSKGGIWLLKKEYKNYTTKHTEINLVGEQMSALMISIEDGYQLKDLGNRIAYSISNVYIGTKSYKLKTGDCKNIDSKFKIFDFDNQIFRKVDRTKDYIQNKLKLNSNFATLRQKYLILLKDKMFIGQAEIKGKAMRELLIATLKNLKQKILEKLKDFKFNYLFKIKNNEFSNILTSKNIRYMLFPEETLALQIGTHEFPAQDCLAIKRSKKSCLSGWYHIKPECAKKILKVYCDFSIIQDAVDIYVFNDDNDIPNPDLSYLKIKTVRDIRYQCATHGLFPIKLVNRFMVERISQVLKLMNYDLNMPQAIPLGYDYNCDQNACSSMYKSLDDRSSNPINSFFLPSKSNLDGKGSFAGLGFSDNIELSSFDLTKKIKIGALICSTNHIATDISDGLEKRISCQTTVSGNGDSFPINNDVIVICPMDCDLFPSAVYGDGMYHSNSSVCKSALHNGVLGKKGGKIHVRVSPPQNQYKQSIKNNISSMEYNINDGLPSFSMEKFVQNCPIDYFKSDPTYAEDEEVMDKESSFLSKSEDVELKNENNYSFRSVPDFVNNLSKTAMDTAKQALNTGVDSVKDLAQNAANNANSIKNKVNDYMDSKNLNPSLEQENNTTNNNNSNNNNENSNNNTENLNDPNMQNQAQKLKNEESIKTSTKCLPNTDLGKKILRSRREESDWGYFAEIKKKNVLIKEHINSFNKLLSWAKSSSIISNFKIKRLYAFVDRFRYKLLRLIKKVYMKGMGRVYRTKIIFKMLQEYYYMLCERDGYTLNYNNKDELLKNELVAFDFIDKAKVKSNWHITTIDINNRPRAIGITAKLTQATKVAATFLKLHHKKFYDFELNVDILFKTVGKAGIAFRYKDPYNYYAIIINRKKGYKELVKVRNGEKTVLKKIEDGGILINSWHTIRIKSEADRFHIFIYDAEQVTRANSEKIIEFEDADLSSGTIAAFTNNIDNFFFDKLSIKGKGCWTPWQPKDNLQLITSTANSYNENFKGNFVTLYEVIDQADAKDGPAIWEMVTKDTDTEEVSIKQKSRVYDSSSMRIPSMVILKGKYIRNGIVRVEFVPTTENGVISIIFKYNTYKSDFGTSTSFYSFDLINHGDNSEDNQFVLRRIDNGLSKELKSINNIKDIENPPIGFTCGYKTSVPHYVQIEIKGFLIKISVSINSRPFLMLFEVTDDTLKMGKIGFGTFHAKAYFTLVELKPSIFNVNAAASEDFIKNGVEEILMNPYTLSTDDGTDGGEYNAEGGLNNNNINNKSFTNKNDPIWKNCVILTTSDSRNNYCQNRFSNEYQIQKCKASFCDTCCQSNVFWVHKNILHTCKKQCYRNTEETNNDSNYTSTCMMSENPDKNIYSYCSNKFKSEETIHSCKYDMCNLCCVNLNTIKQKKHAFETIKFCFNGCSKSNDIL